MRTKYLDKKKELENAFSFGHTKKSENADSPVKNAAPSQYTQSSTQYKDRHGERYLG